MWLRAPAEAGWRDRRAEWTPKDKPTPPSRTGGFLQLQRPGNTTHHSNLPLLECVQSKAFSRGFLVQSSGLINWETEANLTTLALFLLPKPPSLAVPQDL